MSKMITKQFSVVMSVYEGDNPDYFFQALDSITRKQSVKPDEIVIVVDGPISNEHEKVIEFFKNDFNLVIKRNEKNQGLGLALKEGVLLAKNELIARMDSDDIAVSNRFEQQLNFYNSYPDVDVLGGDISEFIDNEKNIVSIRRVMTHTNEIVKDLKKRCPINHVTVMMKKSSLINSGNYIELHYNEDYFLWIRMVLKKCKFMNTGTVLVNVRSGPNQYARRGGYKYFKSEQFLQKFMLKNRIISIPRYIVNILKRFIFQCLIPGSLRAFLYMKVIRSKK